MRASRSWPRSSVPKGWLQDGPSRWALKSMSLIGTCHNSGPKPTASSIMARSTAPATAKRCRRNRHQVLLLRVASPASGASPVGASAIGDARVEPAIQDVGNQIEKDHEAREYERHRHDHWRVVGEDRVDQQSSDAWNAKDLLGNDGTSEHRRHCQRHQCDDRDQCITKYVFDHDDALGDSLGAGGGDVVEADYLEHRGAHITGPGSALSETQHCYRHDRLFELLPIPVPSAGADIGPVNERQPVEINAEQQDEQQSGEKCRE